MNQSLFDPIDDVIKAFSNGEIVVMTDDENRENEGDLICAAEKVNAESINFMITHARGLVCTNGRRAFAKARFIKNDSRLCIR